MRVYSCCAIVSIKGLKNQMGLRVNKMFIRARTEIWVSKSFDNNIARLPRIYKCFASQLFVNII